MIWCTLQMRVNARINSIVTLINSLINAQYVARYKRLYELFSSMEPKDVFSYTYTNYYHEDLLGFNIDWWIVLKMLLLFHLSLCHISLADLQPPSLIFFFFWRKSNMYKPGRPSLEICCPLLPFSSHSLNIGYMYMFKCWSFLTIDTYIMYHNGMIFFF